MGVGWSGGPQACNRIGRVQSVGQLFGVGGRVGQVGEGAVEVLVVERRSCMHFPACASVWGVWSAVAG